MKNQLDTQLDLLRDNLLKMGNLCEELIAHVTEAIGHGNEEELQKIYNKGALVDELERDIERLCVRILLHQHPVAKDLYQVSAALKMITDMERIGDQVEDIASILPQLKNRSNEVYDLIGKMAQASRLIVTESIDAYIQQDIDLAEKVVKHDDIIDAYFDTIKSSITAQMIATPQDGEDALNWLMIAKYFERIGDHATNIAEWVIYSITGEHIRENV